MLKHTRHITSAWGSLQSVQIRKNWIQSRKWLWITFCVNGNRKCSFKFKGFKETSQTKNDFENAMLFSVIDNLKIVVTFYFRLQVLQWNNYADKNLELYTLEHVTYFQEVMLFLCILIEVYKYEVNSNSLQILHNLLFSGF